MDLKRSLAKRLHRWSSKQLGHNKPIGSNSGFLKKRQLLGEKQDPLILDVGANAGSAAKTYRAFFPAATIYSFEPAPETYQSLVTYARRDRKTHPFQLAFSDREGEANLQLYANCFTNSLLTRLEDPSNPPIGEVKVPVTTLDAFCEERGIGQIDILKSDTQGQDLKVLKGAERLLSQGQIEMIYIEVMIEPEYEGQNYFHEVCAYLHDKGYPLFDLYDCHRRKDGHLWFGDALFTKQ